MIRNQKIDRSNWPRGEWNDEPDFLQWIDEKTGLLCEIKRSPRGHLCGYVCVNHKNEEIGFEAHGGVTFYEEKFGFDCAHAGDGNPSESCSEQEDESYKNIHFVKNECRKLALQISQKIGSRKYWRMDVGTLRQADEMLHEVMKNEL